jgi:hypothetical protein
MYLDIAQEVEDYLLKG